MVVKVLLADDEDHICKELEYVLSQEANVEIVAICNDGDETLQSITQLKPDIVFLDIDMPGINGIKLGQYLKDFRHPTYIIYVTAYDKFAVEAFKVGAKGYILKPFAYEEVLEQLHAAIAYLEELQHSQTTKEPPPTRMLHIVGSADGKMYMFNQNDLLMLYAKDRSVFLRAKGKDYFSQKSLSELEGRLNPDLFFRCHRNYIVNLQKIKEIVPWFNSTYLLILDDNTKIEVPVSRSFIRRFKELAGLA